MTSWLEDWKTWRRLEHRMLQRVKNERLTLQTLVCSASETRLICIYIKYGWHWFNSLGSRSKHNSAAVHAGCIRFESWLSDQLSCLRYFHEHRETVYDTLWSPPLTAFLIHHSEPFCHVIKFQVDSHTTLTSPSSNRNKLLAFANAFTIPSVTIFSTSNTNVTMYLLYGEKNDFETGT